MIFLSIPFFIPFLTQMATTSPPTCPMPHWSHEAGKTVVCGKALMRSCIRIDGKEGPWIYDRFCISHGLIPINSTLMIVEDVVVRSFLLLASTSTDVLDFDI
jgi:hypothetical protein